MPSWAASARTAFTHAAASASFAQLDCTAASTVGDSSNENQYVPPARSCAAGEPGRASTAADFAAVGSEEDGTLASGALQANEATARTERTERTDVRIEGSFRDSKEKPAARAGVTRKASRV